MCRKRTVPNCVWFTQGVFVIQTMTSLGFGLGKISAYDKLFADFTLHCSHAWQRDFVGAATLGGIAGPKARHASLYYPSQNFP